MNINELRRTGHKFYSLRHSNAASIDFLLQFSLSRRSEFTTCSRYCFSTSLLVRMLLKSVINATARSALSFVTGKFQTT